MADSVAAATDLSSAFLDAHNRERRAVGVAPLRWSRALEADARGWADQLARRDRLEHARRRGQGENLWMAPVGLFQPLEAMRTFLQERAVFRNRSMPQISSTGRWQDAGHYSQIVWRQTTGVGCASARNGRHLFVVCRYAPAGNVIGEKAY